MKWPLRSVLEWQTLRLLARSSNAPLTGRVLRVDRSRRTKDGTFLNDLVERGLLELVTRAEPEKSKYRGSAVEPAQFRSTYRLTVFGLDAAEYGEHERPDPAPPLPVYDGSARAAAAKPKSRSGKSR